MLPVVAMARCRMAWLALALMARGRAASGGGGDDPSRKGLTEQVVVEGGWLSFGTSFADGDEAKEFAPDDPEGEQIDQLKESLGSDVFGAIAGATGMDKRPSSISKDGAKHARRLRVGRFAIDPTAVSNDQFKRFVQATKYTTEAETFKWSFVHELLASEAIINATDGPAGLGRVQGSLWWLAVFGATWRKPEGPDSSIRGRMDHPAVHVSWNDARAYCRWAGRRLPTEVEWEMAARGGLDDEPFPWGDAETDMHTRLNSWEGDFPKENTQKDGYVGTAPVRAYEPNAFGMYNTVGNVWEWCDGGDDKMRPLRGGSYVDTIDGQPPPSLSD